jgi:U3 small nucleolar ribonucleoprotein protein IMP3
MRELKYHEKKLLKKVDFLNWKKDKTLRESKIMRRYYIQKREDLKKYNRVCGLIRQIVSKLMLLKPDDSYRVKKTKDLLERLYDLGLIKNKTSLKEIDEIGMSKFCRRRLSVILFRNKYCESIKQAITYIEQGQIQLGKDVVYNPALMVTRSMEDHISWVNKSKIKRKIDTYNDNIDDYDANN